MFFLKSSASNVCKVNSLFETLAVFYFGGRKRVKIGKWLLKMRRMRIKQLHINIGSDIGIKDHFM